MESKIKKNSFSAIIVVNMPRLLTFSIGTACKIITNKHEFICYVQNAKSMLSTRCLLYTQVGSYILHIRFRSARVYRVLEMFPSNIHVS